MIYRLLDDIPFFIVPKEVEPDGLIAIGGHITVDWLKEAYAQGIFPWFDFRNADMPYWYCPAERFVIFPSEIHVSHSMRTLMNKGRYSCTINKDFRGVIENCSRLRIDHEGAWLGPEMIAAYCELHELGMAMSVEVWDGEELVGGLYGVVSGKAFCGESMFSLCPNASKLALIALARTLDKMHPGDTVIDCQFRTDHLANMGGRFIPYDEFRPYLACGLEEGNVD